MKRGRIEVIQDCCQGAETEANEICLQHITQGYLQGKDDSTQSRAEHHLNRPPALSRQHIQITGEGDARQEIGEEDIDSTRHHELVKHRPVRDIADSETVEVLTEKAKRLEGVGESHWMRG